MKSKSSGFFERVYAAVRTVPKGKVATYGQIALMIGAPRAARQVGFALHSNPYFGEVPCHRIVNRFGRLAPAFAFGGVDVQRSMLEEEGITVEDNTVDLAKFGMVL